jgi:hypothetical protein
MDQERTDATDALNFNNLVMGTESATNPICSKKVANVELYFVNFILSYSLQKMLYVTFSGRNLLAYVR